MATNIRSLTEDVDIAPERVGRPLNFVAPGATIITLLTGSALQAASIGAAGVVWGDYDAASFADSGWLVMLPGLLGIVGYPLLAVGFAGLFQRAATRAPMLSRIGLAFFLVTMASLTLAAALSVAIFGLVADTVPDVPEAVIEATWAHGSSLLAPLIIITQLAGTLVSVILAVIVFARARIAPVWAIICLGLFGVAKAALPSMPWLDWSALLVLFACGAAAWVLRRRGAWATV